MPEDNVDIRISLRNAQKFQHDAKRSASAVDEIGDQAAQAARRLRSMSAASTHARIQLGPLSTSLRGGALMLGAASLAVQRFTPAVFGAAEAVATLAGGAGAAGGVGLLALGQAAGTASLGLADLGEALGGSEEAAGRLGPKARALFDELSSRRDELRQVASEAMMPGMAAGVEKASKNFGVLRRIVRDTGGALGDVAEDAGTMLGSKAWGRDMKTVGKANVKIIGSLGDAGLHLADGFRHVLVEAAPLAKWLARSAEDGADMFETWAKGARESGDLRDFFRDARRDLQLVASITGHGSRGILNLFGANDVDGTKTLENLDAILGRFERWTADPMTQADLGAAIREQIPEFAGALVEGVAHAIPAAAGEAARIFIDTFMEADAWGKFLMASWLAKKVGVFGLVGGIAADRFNDRFRTKLATSVAADQAFYGGQGTKIGKWIGRGAAAAVAAAITIELADKVKEWSHENPREMLKKAPTGGPSLPDVFGIDMPTLGDIFNAAGGGHLGPEARARGLGHAGRVGVPRQGREPRSTVHPFTNPRPFEPIIEHHTRIDIDGRHAGRAIGRAKAREKARG